jgi:hypothetical protein
MGGGMSAALITHFEILSWSALVGIALQPWEVRCLRRLSGEYLSESHKAEKRGAPAPWTADGDQVDKVVESNATKNALRDLAKL